MMKPADSLFLSIKQVLEAARQNTYRAIRAGMVQAYWETGRLIVEHEQQGEKRAGYGKEVLKQLSGKLVETFGKGYTETNLKYMRLFYLAFPIRHAVRDELGWTHYRLLSKVENEAARQYYLTEAIENNWSTRALERQINSFYYERILSSGPKGQKDVAAEMQKKTNQLALKPEDFIKDPYVLEFLGLPSGYAYKEKDVEAGLIQHIQKFLLELGRGFAFVARQQHIRTENSDFYIDLVFYHFKLKCFVLIDLKLGELTHQDVGQMDMYVRMYKELYGAETDNPPIGIVLCSQKDEAVVKYSVLAENDCLFASAYKLHLPTEEELKHLIETDRQLLEEQATAYTTTYAAN